jgi:hypothetical protein
MKFNEFCEENGLDPINRHAFKPMIIEVVRESARCPEQEWSAPERLEGSCGYRMEELTTRRHCLRALRYRRPEEWRGPTESAWCPGTTCNRKRCPVWNRRGISPKGENIDPRLFWQ